MDSSWGQMTNVKAAILTAVFALEVVIWNAHNVIEDCIFKLVQLAAIKPAFPMNTKTPKINQIQSALLAIQNAAVALPTA